MCNLYNQTTAVEAIRQLFPTKEWRDRSGNAGPPDVYPDRQAVIIRSDGGGMEVVMARWGLPSPPQYHSKSGIDRGVTNVRNTSSPHWRRWLGPENRCLVPFDKFSEPVQGGGIAWFELKDKRPAFLAGIYVPQWTSIRKLKDGPTTDDLFAFLTSAPNKEVGEIHPKAMPVILTEPEEWATWLDAPWEIAKLLQRPLPDGSLDVQTGSRT